MSMNACSWCQTPVLAPDKIHEACKGPAARERRLHRVIAAAAIYASPHHRYAALAIEEADILLAAIDSTAGRDGD